MRKLSCILAMILAFGVAVPVRATVVPPTPEQIETMKKREALENRARAAFGETNLIEKLRDWRQIWGFILVGEQGSRSVPKLLIKDEHGWYELKTGETKRLSTAVDLELNRLLHSPDLWAEDPYRPRVNCSGTHHFVIMHAGEDRFGRLGCGPEGLAARAARIALSGRVPTVAAKTIAPPRQEEPPPYGASEAYYRASSQITSHLFEMAAAFERKTLAGYVEPYAKDVVLEGPFGIYRGRKMAVDWARSLQDWNAPYSQSDKRLRVERIVSKNQEAKNVFYTTHELRWEEAGKPWRQTFSTMWRNYDGLWLIAHERISEVKPVTTDRVT